MDNPLLDGIRVPVADRVAKVASNPVVVVGTDSTGKIQPLASSSGGIKTAQPTGSPNVATSQAASTGTAATLVAARPTRTACYIGNTDAANPVWVGPATVTTSNGVKIPAGGFFIPTWVGLIQIIDDGSNHAVVCVWDEYG